MKKVGVVWTWMGDWTLTIAQTSNIYICNERIVLVKLKLAIIANCNNKHKT